MSATETPNPGSKEACALGCRCPTMDNGYGRGAYIDEHGQPQFWISGDCALHGSALSPDAQATTERTDA